MSRLVDLRRRRCIYGCDTLVVHGVPLHRFPNPCKHPDLFAAWLAAVGDKLNVADHLSVYVNKRVCDHHFKPEEKTAAGRIMWSAVPSLHLNGVRQSAVTFLETEHNYCHPRRDGPASNILPEPAPTMLEATPTVPCGSSSSITRLTIPATQPDSDLCKSNFTRKERILKNEIIRLRQKNKAIKRRLLKKQQYERKRILSRYSHHMSDSAKLFMRMQIQESKKKAKGRRFTLDEKILSLTFFKKSPAVYKLMSKHFTLPSRKTLKSLLSQIKIYPGINDLIFDHLKKIVKEMPMEDKLCNIIFDEMSITPHIHFKKNSDELVGFEDYGKEKTNKLANHVMVFMVKGVNKNYKQPVAYFFTRTMSQRRLKDIIKEVIEKVQSTGLEVISTICDQSATNVSAINSLISETKAYYLSNGKEWRHDVIVINEKVIIPLYDIPHLLKGLRNNLLNKKMEYTDDKTTKCIKWEYFQKVYHADQSLGELKMLWRMTEEHIDPVKMKKMRVKFAAQVFSRSMAVATANLIARGKVPQECQDLIPFVLLVDKLFDSFNAATFSIPEGKIYKGAVKQGSPHHTLWQDAIKMLKTVKFYIKNNQGVYTQRTVPTIKNLIKTIEGFQEIWKMLRGKYLINSMLTRNFNQDPLENFFGNIRSMGYRNVTPNCLGFEGAFKTLLLNNFSTSHSIHANCEEDANSCLDSLKHFITEKHESASSNLWHHIVIDQPLESIETDFVESDSGADQNRAYVCGWVLSKCLRKIVKGCQSCKNKLISNNKESETYQFIRAKEYHKKKIWLCYPSTELIAYFKEIQSITISFLQSDCYEKKLKERIKAFLDIFVNFDLTCEVHSTDFKKYFMDTTINIIIFSWCKSVNRILAGKITYCGEDNIKIAAQDYYNKYKSKK